ncbi:class I SAM-dependent methyltransferase [Nocardioides sp.]|uniref:class I SAM-dependent methyltransferase n=1 Tax=Nocardioides sp. TaxID=35761 RepID=UPI0035288086
MTDAGRVTTTGDAAGGRYTHGHAESVLRSHRWRTAANSAAHLLPHLRPGLDLLDVGAGPGTITADLAELVAPGAVTAVEVSEEAAAVTRDGLASRGVAAEVRVADVHALPFDDGSFDVVHAHQVLQHVADPVQALREMARVARPGGLVAVRDSDYHGFVWAPASPALDRWLQLYDVVARGNGGDPDAGRHLVRWAREAGLEVLSATSSTWCFAEPADREWWGGLWADRLTRTTLGEQIVTAGLADPGELAEIAAGWRAWADDPDGWFSVLHAELLVRA